VATSGVTASNDYSYTKTERVPKKTLDKNDFLNLLVAQLKYQDPLEPQSNEQFITTMAQFNSLETMSSMDKTLQGNQAMDMVGKTVTVQEVNKDPVTGIVERMTAEEGKTYLYIGGQRYSLSDVREVHTRDDASQISAPSWDLMQAALLIGKEVKFSDAAGGVVEKVGMTDGKVMVYVNGTAYDMDGITEIGTPVDGSESQPEPEVSEE
jgi:flagellar basal-body rod modification protein FlgD